MSSGRLVWDLCLRFQILVLVVQLVKMIHDSRTSNSLLIFTCNSNRASSSVSINASVTWHWKDGLDCKIYSYYLVHSLTTITILIYVPSNSFCQIVLDNNVELCPYRLPQMVKRSVFSPVWIRMCEFKVVCWLKDLLHDSLE